ncbi:MAG: ribbon-helix-helix domain-containing protein [Bifidobacteriaceae bacterium]|jgi:RHH-type rel operon transcriptional repressor/antitoxin RelB|nr:ribbon-helix-helix domain-containing protein [Bifidobacteriaceae bacterium]
MLSQPIAVRLPADLAERLAAVARATRRPQAHYIRDALESSMDRIEWEQRILRNVEDVRAGRRQTVTSAELRRRLDLDS